MKGGQTLRSALVTNQKIIDFGPEYRPTSERLWVGVQLTIIKRVS